MNRRTGLWMVALMTAASLVASDESFAVPPRRLARRGVVVIPAPATGAVVIPATDVAPVAVGPVLRQRRRLPMQTGVVAVPGMRGAGLTVPPTTAPGTSPPKMAATARSAAPPVKAPAAVPEPIPAPRAMAGAQSVEAAMRAFTPAWYAKHPEAWRPPSITDVWKTADDATINAWLGQPVAAAGTTADAVGAVATAGGAADVGADGLQSVLVLPAGHNNVGPAGAEWLPLGVFAVVPPGTMETGETDALHQLAVDRQGIIRGVFCDAMSGTTQPIKGSIDRATRSASWTVGTDGGRFTAPVSAFVGQSRSVSMSIGGRQREMQLSPARGRDR